MADLSGQTPQIAKKVDKEKKSAKSKLNEAENTENEAVHQLKQLYLETLKLDTEINRQIYKVEKSFECKRDKIYNERKKILDEFNKQPSGDAENINSSLFHFWLKVLKSAYSELINESDELILAYLSDIRSALNNENENIVNFVLKFYFEPNPYFTDRCLEKAYYINIVPNPEKPFRFKGPEFVKSVGCDIHWKEGYQPETEISIIPDSFFDFFGPPKMPQHEDPTYEEIHDILHCDYVLGFYLKECIIPKAVLHFTGEFAEYMSLDWDKRFSSEKESDETDKGFAEEENEKCGDGESDNL